MFDVLNDQISREKDLKSIIPIYVNLCWDKWAIFNVDTELCSTVDNFRINWHNFFNMFKDT